MRDEAEKRIGYLYPKIEVTAEMAKDRSDLKPYVGKKLTVIAWLWARTVKSPNPAFAQVDVPLASTFMLSTKAGKEAYVEPVIEGGGYRFMVKVGQPKNINAAKNGTKLSRGANFQCLMSGTPIASEHIYGEANAGRMGAQLMAVVAEGDRGGLSCANAGARSRGTKGEAGVEAGTRDAREPALFLAAAVRAQDLRRPLHPTPARSAHDPLRPRERSARAYSPRRSGRRRGR
jgi:adenine-specific DNA methylase